MWNQDKERWKYVFSLDAKCVRPSDGKDGGHFVFGGDDHVLDADVPESWEIQSCPDQEYATGLSIRYGQYVNAVGLICDRIQAQKVLDIPASQFPRRTPPTPPPPPSPPPPSPTPSSPGTLTTGTFDTNFGILQLGPGGGTYSASNGRVTVMRTNGNIVQGRWEQDTSARRCPNGRFWGKFAFAFSAAGFNGSFGYCSGPLNAGPWNGTRK
jgi:hypothetical protein